MVWRISFIVVVEEGRKADKGRSVVPDRIDEPLRRYVSPQIDHLEPPALHHHDDEVLADVVEIALDGADDDLPRRGPARTGEDGLQDFHRSLHGARREHDLRDVDLAVPELLSDLPHCRNEPLV